MHLYNYSGREQFEQHNLLSYSISMHAQRNMKKNHNIILPFVQITNERVDHHFYRGANM